MFHRTSLISALVLVSALAGKQLPAAQDGGLTLQFSQDQSVTVSVSGTVRDKRSNSPIANARLRAHIALWTYQPTEWLERCPYQEAVTDAQGNYHISFLTPLTTTGPMSGKDNLCVYANVPGYETLPRYGRPYVTARNCVFTNLNFALEAGKHVRGVVVNAAGQPGSGAVVRVQNGENGDWNSFGSLGRTTTGEDGSFEVWFGVAATRNDSNPWLSVLKQGVGTRILYGVVAKEDFGSITLNPGGALAGKVLDAGGKPIPSCEVSVRCRLFDLVCKTRTDQEGKYLLNGIPGEAARKEFSSKRGGNYRPALAEVEVYARVNPDMKLKDAPACKIIVQDGQTLACPDLVVGAETYVSGKLLPSKTALSLGGLSVRLDDQWENIVETDINGGFRFPSVSPGKHTLTAYLPHNLRYDLGIGKAEIEVQSGAPVQDVQIQLADLAELRVQYLDAAGNPLPGITAGATWSKNGDGAWTEGTVSDNEGWAVLYLYPDSTQYLRGVDLSRKLTAESVKELKPQPGQVMESLRIVMVPTSKLSGRLVDEQGQPVAGKQVLGTLSLADGTALPRTLTTDAEGRFDWEGVTPGVMRICFELGGVVFSDALGKAIEARPGQAEDLGNVVLKAGLKKAKVIRDNYARALQQPQEITQAAQEFFKKIRTADYDYFLKDPADWQRFPIFGYYQTYKWYDELVQWMSRTFRTNPITSVQLGQVFASPKKVNGHDGLPTVPYRLTLKDGTLLEGDLPFEYNFDGRQGRWYGVEGIDWHLRTSGQTR